MKVAQMVCPSCARVNGQEHHEGCPIATGRNFEDYGAGWQAARDALLPPLVEELERQGGALVASMIALAEVEWGAYRYIGAEPCPACGAEKSDGHKDGCSVAKAIDRVRELIAR